MAQILQRAPSFAEEFASNIGGGLSKGIEKGAAQALAMQLEKGKQKAKYQGKLDFYNELKKQNSTAENLMGSSPKEKEAQFLEIAQKLESSGVELNPQMLDQLWGEMDKIAPQNQNNQQPSLQDVENDEMALTMVDPAFGRQKTEQRKIRTKEKEFGHKSTEKYATELAASSKNAEEIKFATNVMRNAIRSGKTGPTAQNLAYSYLSDIKSPFAGIFQSKEAGQYNVGMKTLASGFKKIMGAKPTEREFFWYENILPGLLKQASTNEAILDYFDTLADLDIKAQEISDRIVEGNGGYRPQDLDVQIRKEMKPFLNQTINEGYALSGEFEKPKGKKAAAARTIFTNKPVASKSNKGKILTDEDTGERFESNGKEWVPLNA